jgi:N-acetylglutamate synthase-like GNAT family acetyltransferase
MINICIAKEQNELSKIIDLRYEILRQPWGQSFESSTDEMEESSINVFAEEEGKVIGCGRLQNTQDNMGQIRFMAVSGECQGKGFGSKVLLEIENQARNIGIKKIILNARDNAVKFYENSGYRIVNKGHLLWGQIQHYEMEKEL